MRWLSPIRGSRLLGALQAVAPRGVDSKKILNGLVAVVHVQMSSPKFAGPTKQQLDAEPARIAVNEIVGRALASAPWWWDRVHEAIG